MMLKFSQRVLEMVSGRHLIALLLFLALTIGAYAPAGQQIGPPATAQITLGGRGDSVKFAVLGDAGTGERPQYDIGNQMATARTRFPFEFVIMLGDNLYGRQQPTDYLDKFERPYQALLNAGVRFYAALGNHDDAAVEKAYPQFNMSGSRYYTYVRKHVRFFVLDTNVLDPQQLAWAESAMKDASEEWKVLYFHHPLYSNGDRHGSNVELRVRLEPLFVQYGVDVVFSGHDHIYERIKPQKGITYFVAGAGGQLRKGGITPSDLTASAFAQDQSFMLVEIAGNELVFQAISRTGTVVDAGLLQKRPKT
jgi:predicted MPP superfamily phosphohydrolase